MGGIGRAASLSVEHQADEVPVGARTGHSRDHSDGNVLAPVAASAPTGPSEAAAISAAKKSLRLAMAERLGSNIDSKRRHRSQCEAAGASEWRSSPCQDPFLKHVRHVTKPMHLLRLRSAAEDALPGGRYLGADRARHPGRLGLQGRQLHSQRIQRARLHF